MVVAKSLKFSFLRKLKFADLTNCVESCKEENKCLSSQFLIFPYCSHIRFPKIWFFNCSKSIFSFLLDTMRLFSLFSFHQQLNHVMSNDSFLLPLLHCIQYCSFEKRTYVFIKNSDIEEFHKFWKHHIAHKFHCCFWIIEIRGFLCDALELVGWIFEWIYF